MDSGTLRQARRWAAIVALIAVGVGAMPILWHGHDSEFATLGSWTGGVLGGFGFIVAMVAIWLTVYLASPQKAEINRMEAARARASEALELVAITCQFALSVEDRRLEDDPATLWTIKQTAGHALEVIESSSRDGLYRLAAHLDGSDVDPFSNDPAKHAAKDSVVLQLMAVQGRLAAITHGHMDLAGSDLERLFTMTIRLYRTFIHASNQVATAATGGHVPISQSVLDLVPS